MALIEFQTVTSCRYDAQTFCSKQCWLWRPLCDIAFEVSSQNFDSRKRLNRVKVAKRKSIGSKEESLTASVDTSCAQCLCRIRGAIASYDSFSCPFCTEAQDDSDRWG